MVSRSRFHSRLALAVGTLLLCLGASGSPWHIEAPCMEPGPPGTFDATAVKDPTVVYHGGQWRVFYTARGDGKYTIGHVAAPALERLGDGTRSLLNGLSEATGYAAAPQVFYFAPQAQWYLIYQTHGLPGSKGRYTPMFVTTRNIDDPTSWSAPQVLVEKFETDKWIDFWVICDDKQAYLFYTRNQRTMMYMTTPVDQFPAGFTNPTSIEGVEVHEAVCVYQEAGAGQYVMLVELNPDGRREFHLSTAPTLSGPWSKTRPFAHGDDLVWAEGVPQWTNMVSHGELLRSGIDQRLEIPPLDETVFLIQGTTGYEQAKDYAEIPWSLGLIRRGPAAD